MYGGVQKVVVSGTDRNCVPLIFRTRIIDIEVTESGILIEVNEKQSENAS